MFKSQIGQDGSGLGNACRAVDVSCRLEPCRVVLSPAVSSTCRVMRVSVSAVSSLKVGLGGDASPIQTKG